VGLLSRLKAMRVVSRHFGCAAPYQLSKLRHVIGQRINPIQAFLSPRCGMTFALKKQVFDGNAHLDKSNGSDWMVAHRDFADESGFFNHILYDDYLGREIQQ
jgi:hypothetical protein